MKAGDQIALSFRQKFPVSFQAKLAMALDKEKIPLTIKGGGDITINFEATHDPDTMIVSLEQPNWKLNEMELKRFQSKSDTIKIPPTQLGSDAFNLHECRGLYNIHTGDIQFTVSLVLTLDRFPQLARLGISAPVRIKIFEKGTYDRKTNSLETHASSFQASGGLMHALTVHPGESDESPAISFKNKICNCNANIGANGMIGKSDQAGKCKEVGGNRLTICKGTQVSLCWNATGQAHNTEVSSPVDPVKGIGNQGVITPGDGANPILITPSGSTEYKFTTRGTTQCDDKDCSASALVTVDVVTAGDVYSLSALNTTGGNLWSVNISPNTTDPNIRITSIRTVPCPFTGAFIGLWDCKKTDANGHVSLGRVTTDFQSPFSVPLVGTWQFTIPDLPETAYAKRFSTVCFEVTIDCAPR